MTKTILISFAFAVAMLSQSFQAKAQTREVSGTVSDESGRVPGVTVLVKGTATGTTTDSNGMYTIHVTGKNAVLVFSFIGYETLEIPVTEGQTRLDATFKKTAIEVEELVVVGYGVQRKSHLTGAITKFNPQDVLDVPTSDITTALQGRLSGVTIQNTTSEVGVAPEIRVRGSGALNTGSGPLVVVDNFVMEDGLQMINPSDIASIEILKDASSAAIYGSRAAHGVIIITTKEGSAMKPRYAVSVYTGIKEPYKLHPMMNYTDYVGILQRERELGGAVVPDNDLAAAWLEGNLGATDWQRLALRDAAMTTNAQLNISGGRTNLKYTVSGGFILDDGLMKQNFNNKFNLRSRLDVELSKIVSIGTNISMVYSKSQRPTNNFVDFMRFPQWIPVRHNQFTSELTGQPVGSYAQPAHFNTGTAIYPIGEIDPETGEPAYKKANPYNSQNHNPISVMERSSNESQQYQMSANAYLNVKITKDLVFRTANSITARYNTRESYRSKDATKPGTPSEGSFLSTFNTNWTTDNTLTYMKKTGNHDLNVMAGVSAEQAKQKIVKLAGTGFPNDYIKTLSAATSFKVIDDNGNKLTSTEKIPAHNLLSFLGRINYAFKDRYLVSAAIRADGDSYFGSNNKWGYFPSVSVGWRVSEENFMKNVQAISALKLRGSFGATGDNSLSANATTNLLYSALYSFGEGTGTAVPGLANISSLIGNPDLGWAKIQEFDFGVDLSLFKNRINLVFDYYYSTTRDMLFLRTASSITGHTQYWTNQGKVRNKGIELTLDTYNFTKKNFTWNTSVNFSLNRNRLLDLGGEARMIKEGYSKERYINIVGGPAIQFYGYKTDGIWKTQEELDAGPKFSTNIDRVGGLKVVDTYKDGELNDKDMTVIGNPYPDFTWGITNTFKIWNFDVQILFQGVHGGDVINADATYKDMQIRNEKYNIRKRWVSEQHVGDGKTPTTFGVPWINTDYDVEDASYAALRNVTIGYTLPQSVSKKLHLKSLRVFVTGNNLLFIMSKSYRGINPEYRNTSSPYNDTLISGYQRGSFPMIMTFTAGIDINF